MSRIKQKSVLATALAAGIVLAASGNAGAGPANGHFVNDKRCDVVADQMLTAELGDVATFTAPYSFAYHDHRLNTGLVVGVPDDGIANDWTVHITNVSGQAWMNLFFVADNGATIGNADGRVEDLIGAPGVFTDAFRIDAIGSNLTLMHESMSADGILQIGEEWEFAVMNFGTGVNSIPPVIVSPGNFAGSSLLGPDGGLGNGNASILATPAVPEPTTIGALALVGSALLMRRPRRHN